MHTCFTPCNTSYLFGALCRYNYVRASYVLRHCHECNMEKIAQGVGERLIQHKVKPSAVLGSRPMPECYFFVLCEYGSALTGSIKVFLVDK